MNKMDRREAIRRTSLALGGVISAPTLAVILKGCTPTRTLEWQPTLFTPEQAMIVEDSSERIIPATETPGAQGVGVPQFIEEMVKLVYKEEDRQAFIKGLNDLEASTQADSGKSFTKLSEEEQYEILNPLNERAAKDARQSQLNPQNPIKPTFFRAIKELTVVGYYTSEIGATQELEFLEIPGNYDGCVPISELSGKTWAT